MYLTVFCTVPDLETARRIARTLVHEELAACVNLLPGLTSVYRWQGQVEESSELLLIIKTRQERYPALEARIKALHPYQVPEIIALAIEQGSMSYLDWISESTGTGGVGG
ncbi:divalent-cation tolerance protein CutA [Meiothermus taiwanensis]|jgi:periplasmic divalent cation tolerance protein|uniref:Divalent-cation tolerance protein CutA n=2 Tax=Meiothermus taiwanensis TaxID=172827 RepID=A0A399DZW1_9DEIN|nr:divalent-cation tolerance protein CutA [Meiothermus taiwanensis]AWR85601.1 CutA1 divalent ion tolerance protein [Meiothermus taiwanensis WR-220]KIQ54325.1 cation tolerance protein CutA [Meiothermus taiwanensis]KZK16657.1 cation tolerance protein CutA [Meiothermus taiwanensis]RIH76863.1 Divalent-cation tolerance protein CutA [Meiothermus taiwanensis]